MRPRNTKINEWFTLFRCVCVVGFFSPTYTNKPVSVVTSFASENLLLIKPRYCYRNFHRLFINLWFTDKIFLLQYGTSSAFHFETIVRVYLITFSRVGNMSNICGIKLKNLTVAPTRTITNFNWSGVCQGFVTITLLDLIKNENCLIKRKQ